MQKIHLVLLFIAILLLSALRLWNLGYSEYIPDETTVLTPVKRNAIFKDSFLLSQRKGPTQFLVANTVRTLGFNPNNELAYRLPFALASILSLVFVYFSIFNLTQQKLVALVSMLLIGLNGFVLAFGRIVQYQSFNLLFSFSGVYVFSKILDKTISSKRKLIFSAFGVILLFLSLATHWDAVFFLLPYMYIFIKFIKENKGNAQIVKKVLLINFALLLILFVPFFVLYFNTFLNTPTHQSYFSGRIGTIALSPELLNSKLDEYRFRNELYHPFYFIEFLGVMAVLGVFAIKKSWPYVIWFLLTLAVFIVLVKKPGTHLYNAYIPLSILAAYGFYVLTRIFRKWFIVIPSVALVLCLSYFTYQNYLLFIDVSVEYPWQQEIIYKNKTRKYDQITLSNNIIGFPMNRHWEEINKVITDDIKKSKSGSSFSYITNEVKSVSAYYMDIPYGNSNNMYAIGIKKPFSFEDDYSFPQYSKRRTIAKIEYKGGMLARIYKIDR